LPVQTKAGRPLNDGASDGSLAPPNQALAQMRCPFSRNWLKIETAHGTIIESCETPWPDTPFMPFLGRLMLRAPLPLKLNPGEEENRGTACSSKKYRVIAASVMGLFALAW
jgi:hypothetical protein